MLIPDDNWPGIIENKKSSHGKFADLRDCSNTENH